MRLNLSNLYHDTFGRFFECATLYKLDLENFNNHVKLKRIGDFEYCMPKSESIALFEHLANYDAKRIEIIRNRLKSGNYLCFAYKDTTTNRLAYTRWLCTNDFYSDTLKKEVKLAENEALTLDSFTHPDYRNTGLHQKMNILMLQWIKENTNYRFVYMIIKCFIPHLVKYPKLLGYKPVFTVVYYKRGSISSVVKLIYNKIN
jgi:hypothetical protein